jgi:DNA-binding response OmpR family regulator
MIGELSAPADEIFTMHRSEWCFFGRLGMVNASVLAMKTNLSAPAGGQVASPLLLLVDDLPEALQLMKEQLSAEGFNCLTASSVAEAIAILETHGHIDLVVLDWVLDWPGSKVIRAARELHPELPVLVVSLGSNDPRTDAMVEQADAFLAKPVSATVLVSQIRRILKRSQPVALPLLPQKLEDILRLDEVNRRYLAQVMRLLDHNASLAAARLGVHRQTVVKMVKKSNAFGLTAADGSRPPQFEPAANAVSV